MKTCTKDCPYKHIFEVNSCAYHEDMNEEDICPVLFDEWDTMLDMGYFGLGEKKMENVKNVVVKINGVKDITDFAAVAQKVDGDILVKKGVYCIDGKSTMGLFSIDMSSGVTVIFPEDATEFEEFLNKFI